MRVNQKVYPDWVQKYRTKGTTVKKNGDIYYLYKRTSKRVPGKKYPQAVDTYIGVITPEGVRESHKKKIAVKGARVYEYGFSKVLCDLCPEEWKKPLGDDWEEILKILIHDWSEYSYLQEKGIKEKTEFNYKFGVQSASLIRRFSQKYGLDIKTDLHPLKGIFLIIMGKEKMLSEINPEAMEILDHLGIELEVE